MWAIPTEADAVGHATVAAKQAAGPRRRFDYGQACGQRAHDVGLTSPLAGAALWTTAAELRDTRDQTEGCKRRTTTQAT